MKQARVTYQKFLDFQWHELIDFNKQQPTKKREASSIQSRKVALRLVKCGELSRAARVLTSAGMAPATEETARKLAAKHPSRREEFIVKASVKEESLNLCKNQLFEAVRNSPKGSGTGPSGWRYEHFRVLLDNPLTADLLYSSCSSVAEGILPESICRLVSAARLIALPKANGDVRPIAIGETLRRLTARAICNQKRRQFANFFYPLQHGVSTSGGTELIIHHIQLLLEKNPEWILLKTDVKNAFNSIGRSHLLNQVAEHHPDIYPHVAQMYSSSSPLVFHQDNSSSVILSEEGIHQGDPLGPVLFSIGIQPLLMRLQDHNPNIKVLAYLDDVFVLGDPANVVPALDEIKSMFREINLVVADHKCEIYSPTPAACESLLSSVSIPVTSEGVTVLGTPIGSSQFVAEASSSIAEKGDYLCNQLNSLNDLQSSMLLLRYCHIGCLNHLARSIPPNILQSAALIMTVRQKGHSVIC